MRNKPHCIITTTRAFKFCPPRRMPTPVVSWYNSHVSFSECFRYLGVFVRSGHAIPPPNRHRTATEPRCRRRPHIGQSGRIRVSRRSESDQLVIPDRRTTFTEESGRYQPCVCVTYPVHETCTTESGIIETLTGKLVEYI